MQADTTSFSVCCYEPAQHRSVLSCKFHPLMTKMHKVVWRSSSLFADDSMLYAWEVCHAIFDQAINVCGLNNCAYCLSTCVGNGVLLRN